MYNLGLTGNVASGKSTVTRFLQSWGAPVIDADDIVHELQRPGSEVFDAIVARFGSEVVAEDGGLDRAALRARMVNDATARESLNAIVHPAVAHARALQMETLHAQGAPIVVNSIPLLFEAVDPAEFDGILLVDAPVATRASRLVEERGLDPDTASALIETQMPAAEKRARATWVIDNDGSVEDLKTRTRAVWDEVRAAAAESA